MEVTAGGCGSRHVNCFEVVVIAGDHEPDHVVYLDEVVIVGDIAISG